MTNIPNYNLSLRTIRTAISRGYTYFGSKILTRGLSQEEIENIKSESQEARLKEGFRVVWFNSRRISAAYAKRITA